MTSKSELALRHLISSLRDEELEPIVASISFLFPDHRDLTAESIRCGEESNRQVILSQWANQSAAWQIQARSDCNLLDLAAPRIAEMETNLETIRRVHSTVEPQFEATTTEEVERPASDDSVGRAPTYPPASHWQDEPSASGQNTDDTITINMESFDVTWHSVVSLVCASYWFMSSSSYI